MVSPHPDDKTLGAGGLLLKQKAMGDQIFWLNITDVFESCMSCSKIFRYPYIKRIMTMEILSETDFGGPDHPFIPNYFIDITDYMDKKMEALQIYDTELGKAPFPRSIEIVNALSMLRGAAAGSKFAEAFKMIKFIE